MSSKKLVEYGNQAAGKRPLYSKIAGLLPKCLLVSSQKEAVNIIYEFSKGNNHFLEIGSDKGDLCFSLSKKFKKVTGIDIDEKNIKVSNKHKKLRNKPNVIFHEADVENCSFERKFNAVACLNTLEYIADPYSLLKKINKSLLPEGIIVISVPNLGFLRQRLRLLFGALPTCSLNHSIRSWDSSMLHYYTKKELKKLIEGTGFTIIKFSTSGFFSRIRKIWIALLGWDIIVAARVSCRKK